MFHREHREVLWSIKIPWTPLERGCLFAGVLLILMIVSLVARAQPSDPRVELGLVPPKVMEGARLFFSETFGGNGRTCGTCHVAEDNLTIEPATIASLAPDDPFFAPTVPGLERPELLRSHGLVLENADGLDREPVFRSTPHLLSLATSIDSGDPDDHAVGENAVGWSADGAPGAGSLRDFATGAVIQHFTRSLERVEGRDFRLPTDAELDALLAFQISLGRTADIDLTAARMSDPAAERGRLMMFDFDPVNCGRCHGNAGANRARPGEEHLLNQSKDTGVDALRVLGLPHDDGRGSPGDEQFSPPPIIEAADTAPFFHVNTIADLEGAIRFYTTPTFTGAVQTFGEAGVQDLAALLRALNAALNAQMAVQRLEAASIVNAAAPDDPTAERLLDLAAEEAADGVAVLTKGGERARVDLVRCLGDIEHAARTPGGKHADKRERLISSAIESCGAAVGSLGSGLEMQLGTGNLAM